MAVTKEELAEIRKWAHTELTWGGLNVRTTFTDPVCWLDGCGQPTVEYKNITANAASSVPSVWKPVCAEHTGRPFDIHETSRRWLRDLLAEVDRLQAMFDECREIAEERVARTTTP